MNERDIARFWSKVDRRGPDECWPWTAAARDRKGYGAFGLDGKIQKAHRVSFLIEHGRWPEPCGLHSCDNPPCCNPRHIFEGTKADNNRDMAAKGRCAHGDAHWMRVTGAFGERSVNARLTNRQALEIYKSAGTQKRIAAQFGVTQATVHFIKSGKQWNEM